MILCRYGGRRYSKQHIGCSGSGLAASMGESATGIGSGRAVCPMPASSRRPRPTARSGSWPPGGTRVASLTHCGKTASGTSAALGPGSLIRWAHRRRQSAADVPCARCRHRPVGLGRRQGQAASPTGVLTRIVKPQAQVSGKSTTTTNHCKGPRRYQCLSRLGRSNTRAHGSAPTARCRG